MTNYLIFGRVRAMPHVGRAAQHEGEQGEDNGGDEEVLGGLQGFPGLWQDGGDLSGLELLNSRGPSCDGGSGDGHDEDDNNEKLKQIPWKIIYNILSSQVIKCKFQGFLCFGFTLNLLIIFRLKKVLLLSNPHCFPKTKALDSLVSFAQISQIDDI